MADTKAWSQKDRLLQVFTDLDPLDNGGDHVLLRSIIGREGLSTPFNYHLQLLSTDHQVTAEQMIGTNVTIGIETDSDKHTYRYLNGFCSRFYSAGTLRDGELRVYEAEVVPWLSFLQLTSDLRIFQNKTPVDVILQVLNDNQLTDIDRANLDTGGIPTLEYCVQYRETAFDFVSRLMEEYGIFYYFRHDYGRHTLVLANRNSAFQEFSKTAVAFEAGAEKKRKPVVVKWQHSYEYRSGKWSHTDFDFKNPKADLYAESKTILGAPPGNPWVRYDYPGRYVAQGDGAKLIGIRREEDETHHHVVEGEGTVPQFGPGAAFTLDKHDRVEDDKVRWVLTAVEFTGNEPYYTEDNFWDNLWHSLPDLLIAVGKGAGGAVAGALFDIFKAFGQDAGAGLKGLANTLLAGVRDPVTKWAEDRKGSLFDSLEPGYQNHFFCVPFKTPIRPPGVTRKPVVRGPQTAMVVGPDGKDIWTDQYGRVRVHFHWDRYGEPKQGDTSCWMRVSEGWAGREWGQQHLPRVGQEVIVTFLEGDPDRPLVTGRVYNGANTMTFALPQYQTRSGLKTRSSPPAKEGKIGYHMLRFEDATGKEQILLRSQRRMDQRVYASLYETTHANRHNLIGYHDDETDEQGGSSFNTIGDEWNLHIHGAKYEGMEDVHHLRVTGNRLESFEADLSTLVGGVVQLNARSIAIEAKTKITLKVGGSYVVIDPSGVAINGPMVRINSGGSPDSTSGVDIMDPVDASISDNGEPGYLEDLIEKSKRAGGGGHQTRHVAAQHGPVVANNGDGTLQFSPGIKVDATDPDYAAQVIQDLTLMQGTQSGAALIDQLGTSGNSTTIKPGNPPPNPPNAFAQPEPNTSAGYADATAAGQPVFYGNGAPATDASGNQLTGTGNGTGTTITYNPDQWPAPNTQHNAPGDVILFHEMQHANNMERSQYDGSPTGDNFDTNEEKNAIGQENQYRDERGVDRRDNHHDL